MRTLFPIALFIGVFLLAGTLERQWQLQAEGLMPAAQAIFPLHKPIDCDVTVTTKQHDHERGKTRCYSRQGEQK